MSIKKFVKFLIRNNVEFTMMWSPDGQTYGIHIILGNCEYFSSINDKNKLLEIKNIIQTYWIY